MYDFTSYQYSLFFGILVH